MNGPWQRIADPNLSREWIATDMLSRLCHAARLRFYSRRICADTNGPRRYVCHLRCAKSSCLFLLHFLVGPTTIERLHMAVESTGYIPLATHMYITISVSEKKAHAYCKTNFDIKIEQENLNYIVRNCVVEFVYKTLSNNSTNFIPIIFIYLENSYSERKT
jgi:hypothetical protein